KEGYAPLSIRGTVTSPMTIHLPLNPDFPELVKISGTMKTFEHLKDGDSLVDVGVAITGFQYSDFFSFSPNQFISQMNDKINLLGEQDIPSNVLLPKQNEKFAFVKIKLEKPSYSVLVPKQDSHNIVGMYAQVPLKSLIAYAVDKGSPVELLKNLSMKGTGILENVGS